MNNPHAYDTWFDYIRLEETHGRPEKIREIYERAIAQIPLIKEKRYWRRYVYIWIYYAIWEETEAKNPDRAKQVYANCIQIIPHQMFTFSKVWILNAKFLIRTGDLTQARKTMGMAIGKCPKEKIFKDYIALELSLREFDRVRILYQKYLEWAPSNCQAWIKFSELERMLGDLDRTRGIFEIAVSQPELDMPEVLWKSYIDFEGEEEEWVLARELYHRLLERTSHIKVFISLAHFEFTARDNGDDALRIEKARAKFKEIHAQSKEFEKSDRLLLLEAWRAFEADHSPSTLEQVDKLMPKLVKKRRKVDGGWEEYIDPIFPDEETGPNLKLLAMAHEWKMKMAAMEFSNEEEEDDE